MVKGHESGGSMSSLVDLKLFLGYEDNNSFINDWKSLSKEEQEQIKKDLDIYLENKKEK
jgi:hypothetical protein